MPVRTLRPKQPHPGATELLRLLVQELRHPREARGRPLILIKQEGRGLIRPIQLYVVWRKWESLSQLERSEIIMDAYEQVKGADEAQKVVSAMGLTPEEAPRMGIPAH